MGPSPQDHKESDTTEHIYRLDTLALNSPEIFFLISKVYILSFDLWSSNCVEREVQLF